VLKRPKLSDILFTELRGQIESGILSARERLPSEFQLSHQFGVSRPIVREALKQLRDHGFVTSRRGAGTFVGESVGAGTIAATEPSVELSPAIQSIADMRRIFEFRDALESEVAWAAAQYRTVEHLAKIEEALVALEDEISRGTVGGKQDSEFHAAIARATQNQFFEAALSAVRPHLDFVIDLARSLALQHSQQHVKMVHQEHAAIFFAIRDGDADGARRAMQTHIRNARHRMFEGIK
jgi:DNA-binding FadR family transcriptional regulator